MSNVIKLNGKAAAFNIRISEEPFSPISSNQNENTIDVELHNRYVAGFNDGQKEALTKLQNEFNEKLKTKYSQLDKLAYDLNEQIKQQTENFTEVVIQTAFAIAEKILRKEIEKDSNIISLIELSLKKVITANEIVVKLHPDDYNLVAEDLKSLNLNIDPSKLRFEKDEMIDKGGCLIETEIGNADARIASQLNELKRKFDQLNLSENDAQPD